MWNFFDHRSGELEVGSSSAAKLTEEAAVEGFALLTKAVLERQTPTQPHFYIQQLDLGGQLIGDLAVRSLVNTIISCGIFLRDLRLYKNQIGQAGVQALGHLFHSASAPCAPGELHLSHNYIAPRSVKELLLVIAKSPDLPVRNPRARPGNEIKAPPRPLWLRLEHQRCVWPSFEYNNPFNNAKVGQEMLDVMADWMAKEREKAGLPIPRFDDGGAAMVCSTERQHGCTAKRCRCSRWSEAEQRWVGCPLVHMPFFYNQSDTHHPQPPEACLHERDPGWDAWKPDEAVRPNVPLTTSGKAAYQARAFTGQGSQDQPSVTTPPTRPVPPAVPVPASGPAPMPACKRNKMPRDPGIVSA